MTEGNSNWNYKLRMELIARRADNRCKDTVALIVKPSGRLTLGTANTANAMSPAHLWRRELQVSYVERFILVRKFHAYNAVCDAFAYHSSDSLVNGLLLAGLQVVKTFDGNWVIRTHSKYDLAVTGSLWQAKYLQALLSHPLVRITCDGSESETIDQQSFKQLVQIAELSLFPVLKMFPLQYRCFFVEQPAS